MTAGPGDWMPAGPVGRGRLRVSHLDREFVVEVLKAAFVQGRLSKDEFDLRVGQALAARTLTVLAALIADLPAGLVTARQRPMPARARPRPPASRVATSGAAAVAALGLLAGIVVTLLSPPVFTSSTTVLLRPSAARYIGTQVALAGSDPVLAAALPSVRPAISLPALRRGIEVKSLTDRVLSISAQGATTTQAARTANAVADSYVHFADANMTPGGARAQVLDRAVAATGTPLPARLLVAGGLGALLGALIGAIAALAFRRSNRRSRI